MLSKCILLTLSLAVLMPSIVRAALICDEFGDCTVIGERPDPEPDCQDPLSPDFEQCVADICAQPGAEESDFCREIAGCRDNEELRGGVCIEIPDGMAQGDPPQSPP